MNERAKISVRGAVQGVGFRPFVFRLATELDLRGSVSNSSQGVFIDIEGERELLDQFVFRLQKEKPPRALIQNLECSFHDVVGHDQFEIRTSEESGVKTALILPDIATCPECLAEIFEPNNRRYLYPFTNCTNCGPRFSIIESLPYDRANTSMKAFVMCPNCEREYHDPLNRRFQAQPNACPACGPQLELRNTEGKIIGQRFDALFDAIGAVRVGRILALKGIGGFQLIVDARNEDAVRRLRARKCREGKPFAVMYPSLESVRSDCRVGEFEERLLCSIEAPIVLLERRAQANVLAPAVAPRNPCVGAMLPYSPLHHILMRELNSPVVATSGNLSDEPICIDEHDALERLRGIADLFLVHNRPIVRHVDDSVVRVLLGGEQILRRARGYAPLPIRLEHESPAVLAVGAHLKNTVALNVGKDVFISQHIGDLETPEALNAFRRVVKDFENLYETTPQIIACDLHPEYLSTKFAQGLRGRVAPIQHHYAHIAACMAENELDEPVLGISWDGTGFGPDGTIWGGEFMVVNGSGDHGAPFTRLAHFRNFHLPGGETAIKQPRRIALGLLWEIFGDELLEHDDLLPLQSFSRNELSLLHQMLAGQINSPLTSSAGRLFDAVASIIGLRQRVSFEGQAAMDLEFTCGGIETDLAYEFSILTNHASLVVDWQPMILKIVRDLHNGQSTAIIAAKFHNTLAEIIVAIARRAGISRVVLTGGCFQNKRLTELAVRRLRANHFTPFWHHRIPPNDGGIAFGQVVAALWQTRNSAASIALANDEKQFVSAMSEAPLLETVH